MAVNKIIYGGETIIDLTPATVAPADLAKGITAFDKAGDLIEGTSTKDSDTSDATLLVAEALEGGVFYGNGSRKVGTMKNNGAVSGTISTKAGSYTVPIGYHDGSGKVQISSTEQAKIIAGNIKSGVTILGVQGTYSGASIKSQSKEATPSKSSQTIQPDSGYDYLSSVTVKAIPYVESANSYGTTVTIG